MLLNNFFLSQATIILSSTGIVASQEVSSIPAVQLEGCDPRHFFAITYLFSWHHDNCYPTDDLPFSGPLTAYTWHVFIMHTWHILKHQMQASQQRSSLAQCHVMPCLSSSAHCFPKFKSIPAIFSLIFVTHCQLPSQHITLALTCISTLGYNSNQNAS